MRPLNPLPAPRSMQHLSLVRNNCSRVFGRGQRVFPPLPHSQPKNAFELSAALAGRILPIDPVASYVRDKFMLHRISWRVVLPVALTATLFSYPARAQSQDQQAPSVAEAARRAREQKKKSEKPARVISDDNLKPAPAAPATPATPPAQSPEMTPQSQAVAAPPEAAVPTAPATTPAEAAPEIRRVTVAA